MNNLKEIHIGELIHKRVKECNVEIIRITNYFKCDENEINKMYQSKSLDSIFILKWSKLLNYDFFRIYSQHIILYAPQNGVGYKIQPDNGNTQLPQFRKNIYTKEIIDFLLKKIEKGEKTRLQIIEEYRIPKTTLYKWLKKYTIQQ